MLAKWMILGGGGILGFLYFKKHPEKIEMMKEMGCIARNKMMQVMEK